MDILKFFANVDDAKLIVQCFVVVCGAIVILSGVLTNSKLLSKLDDYMWLFVGLLLFVVLPVAVVLSNK